ncbi:MAG: bifunctional hydroxymethylpyrimidine kinase/phosphomethylpyrimidine kinase, partial [Sulfobacillus sp.]|nr:bifunctional hydroxymethylpyrimidine kinase/phosphomethylpyrimidine kinase [Sulfobacillus sp.]
MVPRVLAIAGSDPSGGAGIQADLKTYAAFGVYGMTAITALTVQNTVGVTRVVLTEPAVVREQIRACLDDIGADAIKI